MIWYEEGRDHILVVVGDGHSGHSGRNGRTYHSDHSGHSDPFRNGRIWEDHNGQCKIFHSNGHIEGHHEEVYRGLFCL